MTEIFKPYNAFMTHSHEDASWTEELAVRLTDECGFRIWLDKWVLVPGASWQQAIACGLNDADTCAVCVGASAPQGWFKQEIERALDLQSKNPDFRVIPVLLPHANIDVMSGFLSLRHCADFRIGRDPEFAFHVLKQGIKGEAVGRYLPKTEASAGDDFNKCQKQLLQLKSFGGLLHEEVVVEYERKILARLFDEGGAK